MARMTDKTWKEAVEDAHARPWWADALIEEARAEAYEKAARVAEAFPEYNSDRNGFTDLVDRNDVAAAIRALAKGEG